MSIVFHQVRASFRRSCLNMLGSSVMLSTAPPEPPRTDKRSRLVWFDLEMTGLDPEVHHIMEAACIITDSELNIIEDGLNLIIHQPDEVLNQMNDWCKEQHGLSGLTDSCKKSSLSLEHAESLLLSYMEKHTVKGASALAGNTVYMDRLFLMKYLPRVDQHMHYRIIDVSSVKELCKKWAPKTFEGKPKKKLTHRALDDIKESIQELKYYKNNFCKHE